MSNSIIKEFLQVCPKPIDAPEEVMFEWELCLSKVEEFSTEIERNKLIKRRYCTKNMYNKEIREARAFVKTLEAKLIIRRPASRIGRTEGTYIISSNTVLVNSTCYSRNFSVLFVLFHELRHLEHFKLLGLFPEYYSSLAPLRSFLRREKDGIPLTLASPYLSYAAEIDCDVHALRRMNDKGYPIPHSWYHLYPLENVKTMHIFTTFQARIKESHVRNNWKKIAGSASWVAFLISSGNPIDVFKRNS